MDGRCQDEYLHSTDPRLDGERVNVTFRWIEEPRTSVPVGCWGRVLLTHLCKGFIRLCMRGSGWAGMVLWVDPVVLAWVGVVASGLPRPRETLAWEEHAFLSETFVFTPEVHVPPYVMQGKILGSVLVYGFGVVGGFCGGMGFFGVLGV